MPGGTSSAAAPRRPRTALGSPNFVALWGSSTAANLADGLFQVALPLLALTLTSSPSLIAAVTFALTLPWLLVALPVGALVDRFDRRRTMLAANLLRVGGLALLTATVALGVATLPVLYLVALVMGTAEVAADTAAQALLPALVTPQQLEGANARLVGAQTIANAFAGPALGGALAGTAVWLALGSSGGLYAAAAVGLALLRGSFRPAPDRPLRRHLAAEVGEGLRFLLGHRLLRTLAVVVFVMNLGWAAWLAVLVVYAVRPGPMGLSQAGYGLLVAASGVGGVAGTLLTTPALRLLGRRWAIGADIPATVAMLATPALTANRWAVGAAALVGGAGATMWTVLVTSIRQQAVPDRLLGRVSSAWRLFSFGAAPVGSALAGVIAQAADVRAVFAAAAVASALLLVPFLVVVTDQALAAATTQPANPPTPGSGAAAPGTRHGAGGSVP
jgi:MFS family permease